jgi:DtxR family Mn-dependent transcriptional regulator
MNNRKFINIAIHQNLWKMSEYRNEISVQENRILEFIYRWLRPIRVGDLCKELKIKHTTLNSQLKLLEKKKLIKWNRYGPVKLTQEGIERAKHLNRHHGILETFLIEILGMEKKSAQLETFSLSPVVSCDFINSIGKKFSLPTTCACGNTIPTAEECYD